MQGLNNSNFYPELDDWNKKAHRLVEDIECTINGFSDLLSQSSRRNKENIVPNCKNHPIKASHSLNEQSLLEQSTKSDPFTVKRIIRAGIAYLKNSSPRPLTDSSECILSNSYISEPSLPFSFQPIKVTVRRKNTDSKESKGLKKRSKSAKRSNIENKDKPLGSKRKENKSKMPQKRGRSLDSSKASIKPLRSKSAKRS
ncbi:unnamed protein product [Blepharisma stoltei]|uniref:Uncharacterized protein n=1 Tax=Blepharisma stoltei TaxID=1481888 RepID=A0AAU9JL97_9CILI|nr:unnamed protein product [Blepharisma stoltei]